MLRRPPEPGGDRLEDWFDRVHPSDLPKLKAVLAAHLEGDGEHFELEHRMVDETGRERWVLVRGAAVRGPSGVARRLAGSLTDITARKRAEQQLLYDAFHDGLTGLANRALFVDRLSMAAAATQREPSSQFAVLVLDLDRFKTVNDSLGHAVGDDILVGFARRLQSVLRPFDTVARLGGDEFAILLGRVADVADAIHVAKRIQERLASPFETEGRQVYISASIGIALSSPHGETTDRILRDADIAMYRAKAGGRSRYEVFDHDMHRSAVALLKVETDLRQAVANGDFVMHYQPIVSLEGGGIVGFEGLVRWNHPERGLVAPTHFIGVAEETGLIVPLGWWVLRESCLQAREWQQMFPSDPPLFISVNVSGKLFMNEDMVDRVVEILEETRLDPSSLKLEVTENVVMDHGESALTKLLELRALGIQLSVDDFGTGYSSLSYLQRFHYDSLKIDRSFVSEMAQTRDSRTIVETILSLAHGLGIGVIAEGVETEDQVARLRQLDCPHGQGFWFARPLAADAATQLIASSPSW
jgi:diguanylate cyclase (GGDEF)-like protein